MMGLGRVLLGVQDGDLASSEVGNFHQSWDIVTRRGMPLGLYWSGTGGEVGYHGLNGFKRIILASGGVEFFCQR